MPISALAGLVLGVAVVSIGLYHATFIAPRFKHVDAAVSGAPESSSGDTGEALVRERSTQAAFAKRTEERLERIEAAVAHDLLRIGFLRYNSFSDVGSDQSFTLALLNSQGDGVVVTSIFAREETRTYGKAVRHFTPQQGVSKEEQTAIAMARNGDGVLTTP